LAWALLTSAKQSCPHSLLQCRLTLDEVLPQVRLTFLWILWLVSTLTKQWACKCMPCISLLFPKPSRAEAFCPTTVIPVLRRVWHKVRCQQSVLYSHHIASFSDCQVARTLAAQLCAGILPPRCPVEYIVCPLTMPYPQFDCASLSPSLHTNAAASPCEFFSTQRHAVQCSRCQLPVMQLSTVATKDMDLLLASTGSCSSRKDV